MWRRTALLVAGSLGPLMLAVVWFEVQRARADRPDDSSLPPQPPTAVFYGHIERIRDRRGIVTWQLEAERVTLTNGGDYQVDGLTHGQYFNAGQPLLHLSAAQARYEQRGGNIGARGGVRLSSPTGVELRAGSAYWFEGEGRLVVPDLELVQWREPGDPTATPVAVSTPRAFYWPREGRAELPDPVAGRHGQDSFRAASARVRTDDGRLQLRGPAAVDAFVTMPAEGVAKPLAKRLKVAVGPAGEMAYNSRTGGALLAGGATLAVPADNLEAACREATYDGRQSGRASLRGEVRVTTPKGVIEAPSAVIDTGARKVQVTGPVRLTLSGPGSDANIVAGSLVYWYEPGRSRASASGGVTVTSGSTTVRAPRAEVDLEAEVAVLSGGVRLQHLARASDGGEPVTVAGPSLRHTFGAGRRRSEMSGALTFVLREARGQAQRMSFDHERELLVVEGRVRIRTNEGETARCPRATYEVGSETLTIEAPAEATVELDAG